MLFSDLKSRLGHLGQAWPRVTHESSDTMTGTLDSCKPESHHVGGPLHNIAVSTVQDSRADVVATPEVELGRHLVHELVQILVQISVSHVFSVPSDFNLTLLDHLIAEPGLNNIGCCNELNAGYTADGYAGSRGVGVW